MSKGKSAADKAAATAEYAMANGAEAFKAGFEKAIKNYDLVLGYGKDAREKEVLKNMLQIAGFKDSTNAQLIPIRQLEFAKARAKVENDAGLSAADRTARLGDIDAKLAELAKQAK